MTHWSITSRSRLLPKNTRMASRGVFAIGSEKPLNDVFTSTGRPVTAPNASWSCLVAPRGWIAGHGGQGLDTKGACTVRQDETQKVRVQGPAFELHELRVGGLGSS